MALALDGFHPTSDIISRPRRDHNILHRLLAFDVLRFAFRMLVCADQPLEVRVNGCGSGCWMYGIEYLKVRHGVAFQERFKNSGCGVGC